jgi:ABC-2 type transport system permease protein
MRNELERQLRRRRTAVGLAGIAAVPVILAVAFLIAGAGSDGPRETGDPTGLFGFATASGLNFALMSTAATAPFLLLSVVALFAGHRLERGGSRIAALAARASRAARDAARAQVRRRAPAVARRRPARADLGMLAGTIAYGWGPVITPFGPLAAGESMLRLAAITGYLAWSAVWVAALAFALSTTTDTSVGAVAGTIVIVIVVQILDAITALGWLRTYLPVHEGLAWVGLLADPPRWGDLTRGVLLQLPYLAAGTGYAWWNFLRKDVLS